MTDRLRAPLLVGSLVLILVVVHTIERSLSLDLALHVNRPPLETLLRALVAMWSHGNWIHLASNVAALAIFATVAVRTRGTEATVTTYLAGGIIGSATVVALAAANLSESAGVQGSSAAVLALVGLVLAERLQRRHIDKVAVAAAGIAVLAVLPASPGVSAVAHLGGLVTGLALGFSESNILNHSES